VPWPQIVADVLGRDIERPARSDASVGSAMLAGIGVGLFGSWRDAVDRGPAATRRSRVVNGSPRLRRALRRLSGGGCGPRRPGPQTGANHRILQEHTMKIQLPRPPEPRTLEEYEVSFLETPIGEWCYPPLREEVNELFLKGIMPGTIHRPTARRRPRWGRVSRWAPATGQPDPPRPRPGTRQGCGRASLMAELLKATGCCRGRGGSLHVGDVRRGALPGSRSSELRRQSWPAWRSHSNVARPDRWR